MVGIIAPSPKALLVIAKADEPPMPPLPPALLVEPPLPPAEVVAPPLPLELLDEELLEVGDVVPDDSSSPQAAKARTAVKVVASRTADFMAP
jgi:hypothetical protein